MIWRFSDGTTVELGGNVEGDSYFAQYLREEIVHGANVRLWPPPGGVGILDAEDAAQLNAWIDQRVEWLTRVQGSKVKLTERPENVPPLPPPPWTLDPDAPADRVY